MSTIISARAGICKLLDKHEIGRLRTFPHHHALANHYHCGIHNGISRVSAARFDAFTWLCMPGY